MGDDGIIETGSHSSTAMASATSSREMHVRSMASWLTAVAT